MGAAPIMSYVILNQCERRKYSSSTELVKLSLKTEENGLKHSEWKSGCHDESESLTPRLG